MVLGPAIAVGVGDRICDRQFRQDGRVDLDAIADPVLRRHDHEPTAATLHHSTREPGRSPLEIHIAPPHSAHLPTACAGRHRHEEVDVQTVGVLITRYVWRTVFAAHPGAAFSYHRSNSSPIVVSNARRRDCSGARAATRALVGEVELHPLAYRVGVALDRRELRADLGRLGSSHCRLRHQNPRGNRGVGKAELLPKRSKPGQLDSRLTELGWVWSRHLDFLSETTTVTSARVSVNPGYFQFSRSFRDAL